MTGGEATAANGVISTRSNASNWTGLINKPPIGRWELALSESARTLFKGNDGEQLDDILFVLTYGGRTPAWPDKLGDVCGGAEWESCHPFPRGKPAIRV